MSIYISRRVFHLKCSQNADLDKELSGVRRFVRKELRDSDRSGIFKAECANLDYVRRIKDDHIVKVVKAYKHGDVGNIIFPEAMTNLGHYLRDAPFGAPCPQHSKVEYHPFFDQMLGMARSLHKILDYEAEDDSRNIILYGYHFDLKPANILVEESGRFIISDFGQAHFREAGSTSSKVVGFGGTESYAPPEIDDPKMVQNRRYDIWSLGCIYLEICSFIILGYGGVHELDRLRISTSADLSTSDDRFFTRSGTECYVKSAILSWMCQLPGHCQTASSKAFTEEIIALVRSMLHVSVEQRCTSKQLCYELASILNTRQPPTQGQTSSVIPIAKPVLQGVEIGVEAMACCNNIKYHLRFWNSGPIKFARTSNRLDLYAYEHERWTKVTLGDVRQLKLVPRYAMHDTKQHRYQDSSAYLEANSHSSNNKLTGPKFWSESIKEVFHLQEALTAQKISQHLEIHAVSLSSSLLVEKRMPAKLSWSKPPPPYIRSDGVASVQLWTETPQIPTKGSDNILSGSSGHIIYNCPSTRRIVVLTEISIHIVRIDDHICLSPDRLETQDCNSLCWIPTNKTANGNFLCLTLERGEGEVLPGVPLLNKSLEFDEEHKSKKLTMLRIDFKSFSEMQAFREDYRKLKYRWDIEQKSFSKMQHHVGPSLGYARNAR